MLPLPSLSLPLLLLALSGGVDCTKSPEELAQIPIDYYSSTDPKYNYYTYDPAVNPPWAKHTEELKGEAVFVDHESMKLAVPDSAPEATIRIDMKHCRPFVDTKLNSDENCFCYKIDGTLLTPNEIEIFAKKCKSRDMAPICLSDNNKASIIHDHQLTSNDLLAGEGRESYAEFTFDIAKGTARVREVSVPVPLVKKMYRIGSYKQIDVIEFKTPLCLHIEFENLIYAGNLIQSTPFPRPSLPNKCLAGCVCNELLDIEGKKMAIDTVQSTAHHVEFSKAVLFLLPAVLYNILN